MRKLVLATSNQGKLKEIEGYLQGLDIELVLKSKDLEVEETGSTFMENAILKASQVALAMGEWAIADDSGLMIDALDGAPGLFSARYAPTPEECIDRVLRELEGKNNRQGQFVCAVAIASGDGKIILQSEGICRGEILTQRKGQGGFGYDPIFYVPKIGQTFAEISSETKDQISHRGLALENLLPQLKELLS
ncbi:RdgB/HAM1 family non-canonical purine NTP pyrophosphatase [Cyanobacterium sp. IPPAS B-1200]|uniref:RdgB/HAM1 family non-canonical purine NTP pyrophosphatase n=1 Tax=Cyanobacterium sp. IPPAS B-1200 TaxID=1562720 RepID=UPI00085251A5|nr:RdgB/HAM1 family non-canonical purine NTP pyrophosphatase [Cyanobacterium sp. IPPAS B-1200]OEJ80175.1 non-canonical purine NTP pyrophosphatase [Cyanobacterium sp. IPPAS B-1200]